MFKAIFTIVLGVWAGLILAAATLYIGSENTGFQLLPLDVKFGTSPDKDASLEPVVHLANAKAEPFCTAFIVDANYAVTAAHCINGNGKGKLPKENLKILDEKGNDIGDVQAVGFHDRSDLGLLKGNFKKFLPLPANFYDNGFEVRRMLAACGFPYGQKKLICNTFVPMGNSTFTVKGIGYLIPAMSGGPVIDPQTGIAIGVNYAVDENYAYVRPLQGFLGIFDLE